MPKHLCDSILVAALICSSPGCRKKAEEPTFVAEGYYQCLFRGVQPVPSLDFVIGTGHNFHAFNTERGIYAPGTHTFSDGVITFKGSSLGGMRMRAEPDTDDHSGPFRLMDGKIAKPFLCSWKGYKPVSERHP